MKIDIIWFRRDLRVDDNPLISCAESPLLPIFIFDRNILDGLPRDDRRMTFIFDKVIELKKKLRGMGLDLAIFYGRPSQVFDYISKRYEIRRVFASGDNDRYARERDAAISSRYSFHLVHDNFLIKPETVLNQNGQIYKVFSHFKGAVMNSINELSEVKYEPKEGMRLVDFEYSKIIRIEDTVEHLPIEIESIGFERQKLEFEGVLRSPSELLRRFEALVVSYGTNRNFPALNSTSLMSVHLRFGTISIREVFRWAISHDRSGDFLSELIWREFFNYILYHKPESEFGNFRDDVEIAWENDETKFERWKNGLTGFPIVDAGMRQLESEGYIHNRVRMIVASFLTKNLHIDWKLGEQHFSLKLLDYEASSNVGNWQWVAGTGTDTKMRFFNPFLQAKKFDPNGEYIKRYVPELRDVPPEKLHDESFMTEEMIPNYPRPMVSLRGSVEKFKRIYRKTRDRKT